MSRGMLVGSSTGPGYWCICQRKGIHTSAAALKKFKPKGPSTVKPGWEPSPLEQERIYERRVKKAEREERMGITRMLEVPKTYLGGFTRPRDLPALKRFAGGNLRQVTKGDLERDKLRSDEEKMAAWRIKQRYEAPAPEAYSDHSLCLVVSRYARRHPPGRAVQRQSFNFSVATPNLPYQLAVLNSLRAPADQWEEMENAVWPWKMTRRLMHKWGWMKEDDEAAKGWKAPEGPPPADIPSRPDLQGLPLGNLWTRIERENSEARRYLPTLAAEPFFTPLLTVTLPTRPLIDSLERLSKGLPKGTPFFSAVPNDERKDGPGFHRQLLRMRLNRTFELVQSIAERYQGAGGGFPGIRFNNTDVGMGILGERVATGIEPENRRIIIHVHREQWAKETMDVDTEIERWAAIPHVVIKEMDAWGYELDADGKPVTQGVNPVSKLGFVELLEREKREKEAEVAQLTVDSPAFVPEPTLEQEMESPYEAEPAKWDESDEWEQVEQDIQQKAVPSKVKPQKTFTATKKQSRPSDAPTRSFLKESPPHLRPRD